MSRTLLVLGLLSVLAGALFLAWHLARPPADDPEEEDPGPNWFEDVTDRLKLKFTRDAGRGDDYPMPRVMGAGGAFLDFDNDGRLDILLIHTGGPRGKKPQLFRQRRDGTFAEVRSGLDFAGDGMGVAVGDFDNDGWVDV